MANPEYKGDSPIPVRPLAGLPSPRPIHAADLRMTAREALSPEQLIKKPLVIPEKGWQGLLYKSVRINAGVGAAERRQLDLEAAAKTPVNRGHPWTIAVGSGKGGVGKTTVAALLASVLGMLRGDRILAIDGNPDSGTLALRVKTETRLTVADLLRDFDKIQRLADFRAYTSQVPENRLEVLAAPLDPQLAQAIGADDYRKILGLAAAYYNLIFVDLGTGLLDSANKFFLEEVDQAIVVTSPAVDGSQIAAFTLDVLAERRGPDWVQEKVILVINAVRKDAVVDVDRMENYFRPRVRAVQRIGWEKNLATGAQWTMRALSKQLRQEILELGAMVATGFDHQDPRR